jgi:hypothetical protein
MSNLNENGEITVIEKFINERTPVATHKNMGSTATMNGKIIN